MEKNKMIQDVLKCYEDLDKIEMNGKEGWCNLAKLGPKLSAGGIDYKGMGYGSLTDFVKSLNIFDLEKNLSNKVPVSYICKKDDIKAVGFFQSHERKPLDDAQVLPYMFQKEAIKIGDKCKKNEQDLLKWANMGKQYLEKLAEIALPETWSMGDPDQPYELLKNYIKHTFNRLWYEEKICFETDENGQKYAAFNTGLVNNLYDPIYALLKENAKGCRKCAWYCVAFCAQGVGAAGKTLHALFGLNLPQTATYFTQKADLLYDESKGVPVYDAQHLIIDRIDRYPTSVLKDFIPKGCEFIPIEGLSKEEKDEYFDNLRNAMRRDDETFRNFDRALRASVESAVKRVGWNYKSAIPMYYPKRKEMCFLLPLTFQKNNNKVELALVVSNKRGGYQGETIYSLDWAYKCARLVCRPESEWLSADNIQTGQLSDFGKR